MRTAIVHLCILRVGTAIGFLAAALCMAAKMGDEICGPRDLK